MDNKLGIFFKRFQENLPDFYNVPEIVRFLQQEIQRKRKIYPFWKKKVRFSFASYKKQDRSLRKFSPPSPPGKEILQYFYHDDHLTKDKRIPDENITKIIPRESDFQSVRFFQKKIYDLFSYFLTEILPFDKRSLAQTDISVTIYRDIFIDFQYSFSKTEIQAFKSLKNHYNLSEKVEKIIEFIFSSLVHTFGMQIGDIIPENFQIEMISGVAHVEEEEKVDFVISVRQRERNLKDFFLHSHIYQFSELFQQIPQTIKNKLRMQKDLIYLLALERYFGLQPYIISVLARIQKKCISLQHVTPLLDILNFVFSRVEDSVYDTNKILDYVAEKFTKNQTKREELLKLFDICNKNAVLFGTFQSNNRSQLQEQYRLFFLYNLQFFGTGIDRIDDLDNFILPSVFKMLVEGMKQQFIHFSDYFTLFERFLQISFALSSNPAFKIVFKHIFQYNVDDLNEDFFSAFITSLNKRIFSEISISNKKLGSNPLQYPEVVDFIIKTIYHSIHTIFIAEDPLKASKNFRDSISRYSPKNIALRSLELLFFKEIPLSDNNWMNYNLSRNKEKVKKLLNEYIKIPKDYFFSNKKLLHISMKHFYSLESETVLEEWLGEYILKPFFAFIDSFWSKLKNKKTVTSQLIFQELFSLLSKSIINPQSLDNLEILCEKLASTFSEVF